MTNASRRHGALLMGLGMLVFLGTNAQMLPAEAFFPGLAVCLFGVVLFMKGNRVATEAEEKRVQRALNPAIRNESAERFAAEQAKVDGRLLEDLGAREGARAPAHRRPAPAAAPDEIVLYDVDEPAADDEDAGFVVSTDVSFPVEVQQRESLAEQLQKLQKLRQDGVIDDEEFAIAKAKLLD